MSHRKSYRKLAPRIARARKRARDHGLPGDLTLEEFAQTIAFFHGSCAYCRGPAQTIDHFIPLGAGMAGSTVIFSRVQNLSLLRDWLVCSFEWV